MALLHCPVCGRSFDSDHSTAMPFCSVRCRQIDLGRWLDGRYSLEPDLDEESLGQSPADGQGEAEDTG